MVRRIRTIRKIGGSTLRDPTKTGYRRRFAQFALFAKLPLPHSANCARAILTEEFGGHRWPLHFHGDGSNVPMRLRQVALFTRMQPASQAPELGQVWAEQSGGHAQAGGHRRPASARGCPACDTKQSISFPEG